MPRAFDHTRVAGAAALLVGLMVALQSRINGTLAQRLLPGDGSPTAAGIHAALISFGIGLAVLTVALVLTPKLRAGMRRIAFAVRDGGLRPWHLLGGAGGAWLVATQGITVPTLGVALFIVAVVAGQTGASLGVDAVGLGPQGRVPITGNRVLAAVLATAAVGVIAAPQVQAGSGTRAMVLALLVVSAGAAIAVQQAVNAKVGVAARNAVAAAVVNFMVGTAVLAACFGVGSLVAGWRTGTLPGEPWLYLGGPIGVTFIAIAAWAVPVIGVLRFALASIAGQLAGGALLDVLVPQPGVVVGWPLLVGLLMTFVAVVIGNRRR